MARATKSRQAASGANLALPLRRPIPTSEAVGASQRLEDISAPDGMLIALRHVFCGRSVALAMHPAAAGHRTISTPFRRIGRIFVNDHEKDLIANETIHYVGRVSLWTQTYWGIAGLAIIVISLFGIWATPSIVVQRICELGIALGIVVWIVAYFRYRSHSIVITNMRIIIKAGVLARRTNELNIRKTESLQVEQSITGRMFNYGSIVVAGTGGDHAYIHGISNPQALRRAFAQAQNLGE